MSHEMSFSSFWHFVYRGVLLDTLLESLRHPEEHPFFRNFTKSFLKLASQRVMSPEEHAWTSVLSFFSSWILCIQMILSDSILLCGTPTTCRPCCFTFSRIFFRISARVMSFFGRGERYATTWHVEGMLFAAYVCVQHEMIWFCVYVPFFVRIAVWCAR